MEATLLVTRSLSTLKAYLDPNDIKQLKHNALFSFDCSETTSARTPRLYVLKSTCAISVVDALDTVGSLVASDADRAALRTFLVNETIFAAERAKEGDTSFERALACFSAVDFTGLLIINVDATPLQPAVLGPASLVATFAFRAPFVNVSPLDFSKDLPDPTNAHVSGYVVGTPGRDAPTVVDADDAGFMLETVRLVAGFADHRVASALLTCRITLRRLFSLPVRFGTPFVLVGAFSAMASSTASGIEAYRFRVVNQVELSFAHRCLRSVVIDKVASTFTLEAGTPRLRLSCAGTLAFASLGESFDPFSFGPDDSPQVSRKETEHLRQQASVRTQADGLAFTGLELVLDIPPGTPAFEANYRSIALDERVSRARASSFAAQVPHRDSWFLSDQDGGTPEALGYRPITSPATSVAAVEVGTPWYGIVYAVELLAGSNAEFLFAFQSDGSLYCGARLAGVATTTEAMLPATSFFGLRFRELSVSTFSQQEGVLYRIILRGLKASVLGMQLPEGACDILLVAHRGVLGWYAAYDAERKGR